MVDHLLLATRISAREIVSLVWRLICRTFRICNRKSKRRSSQRHTTQLGLHYQSGRVAAYQTSPPQLTTLEDVRRGESPFQQLEDVRNGDRPDTVRASRTRGGKDVAVARVKWQSTALEDVQHWMMCMDLVNIGCGSIEGTRECAALEVHESFGHRLSHHCNLRVCCNTWTTP